MHIAVFCGSSLQRNKEIVEAAAVLGRRIAQEGHTLVYGGSNLGLMGVVDFHSESALCIYARPIFAPKVHPAYMRGENAEMKQQIEIKQ